MKNITMETNSMDYITTDWFDMPQNIGGRDFMAFQAMVSSVLKYHFHFEEVPIIKNEKILYLFEKNEVIQGKTPPEEELSLFKLFYMWFYAKFLYLKNEPFCKQTMDEFENDFILGGI